VAKDPGPMETLRQYGGWVLGFYVSLFLLVASGRLGSYDAGGQLQAALLLVHTGSPGAATPPEADHPNWVKSPGGNYFENHDIGNILLMVPAALAGKLTSRQPVTAQLQQPPLISRVAASLTNSLFSALGAWWLFRFFEVFAGDRRRAFRLSAVVTIGTFFIAYARFAWDVIGSCNGACLLAYGAVRVLREEKASLKSVVCLSAGLTLAGWFRYSTFPFFAIATFLWLGFQRARMTWPRFWTGAALAAVGLMPSLLYNFVRMGSFLRPATMAAQFSGNRLTTPVGKGLFGLLASPNRGLLEFAPVLLALLLLPWVWPRLGRAARQFIVSFGIGSAGYIWLIAHLGEWGSFGWGPRYLVPVLPMLGGIAGLCMLGNWLRFKWLFITLILVSGLVNFPTAVVNWQLTSSESPHASDQSATVPYQQMAVWQGLWLGVQGRALPAPTQVTDDRVRETGTHFPDWWTFRLIEQGGHWRALGVGLAGLLGISTLMCLRRLLVRPRYSPVPET